MLSEILKTNQAALLERWVEVQAGGAGYRPDRISPTELREQSREFLAAFERAARGGGTDVNAPAWADVRQVLDALSASRAERGFSPSETAMFVFSLKEVIFERLRAAYAQDPAALADETWQTTMLLDKLGLYTMEVFQRSRDGIIIRQQQEMLELSTPVVTLWDGILALPVIGTLDSNRTQIVMENLLHRIVETGASIAIIDITGVPTVDTLTAQHLLKTVAAARLMGADCIISGIRP